MTTQTLSLMLSAGAVCVSMVSLYFARKFWSEGNRPILTTKVVPLSDHDTRLNLVIRNTGSRPAIDVQLSPVSRSDFEKEFLAVPGDTKRRYVESCFREVIPVIENGETASALFGSLSPHECDRTWKNDPFFVTITIRYSDLDGRKFSHEQRLRITNVKSFAEGVWILKDMMSEPK